MTDRAEELQQALEERGNGAGAFPTPYGEVRVVSMTVTGNTVDVVLEGGSEGGDPHFRIENPPLLVPDVHGDIGTANGPHRKDPIVAVAYVVGSLGGAVKLKGRGKR